MRAEVLLIGGSEVHDRGAVEPGLKGYLPDRLNVSVANVEGREQHAGSCRQHHESQHDREHLQPAEARRHAVGEGEDEHGDEVHPQVEQRCERDGQGHDHPGKANLAQESLPQLQRGDAVARGLREVGPEHDRGEQVHAVVGDPRADVDDLREEEVEHAEEQQRAHQRPQVAERGAEVAQLELGARQRQRQLDETSQAAAEGGRAIGRDRLGRRLGGLAADHGHGPRSIWKLWGRSTVPPPVVLEWTMIELMSSAYRRRRRRTVAVDRRHQPVAPGSEPVVKAQPDRCLASGGEAPGRDRGRVRCW